MKSLFKQNGGTYRLVGLSNPKLNIDAQCVTEQLKSDDMMKWVGMVTNICACADEIIRNELIYS